MTRNSRWMPCLLAAYCAATLLHFSHNAVHLDSYPNMPAWLSPAGVCAAWTAMTAVGVAGYLLLRSGYRRSGLLLLAGYGALGLDSLSHYGLAPFSAHSLAMNLTILLDAAAATLVLAAVAMMAMRGSFKGE